MVICLCLDAHYFLHLPVFACFLCLVLLKETKFFWCSFTYAQHIDFLFFISLTKNLCFIFSIFMSTFGRRGESWPLRFAYCMTINQAWERMDSKTSKQRYVIFWATPQVFFLLDFNNMALEFFFFCNLFPFILLDDCPFVFIFILLVLLSF